MEPTDARQKLHRGKTLAAAVGLSGLVVGIIAPFDVIPESAQAALGLIVFAVLFWSSLALPLELTSLLLLLAMPALGLLPFDESFAPFAQKTLWLLFAGMVISQAITYSGTDEYLTWRCVRFFAASPFRLLLGLHLLGLSMSLLVPSGMVRVLILIPLGIKLAERLGGGEDRALAPAILSALVCSTYYGGCGVLTGSVPNIVVAAQLELYADRSLLWTEWLRWMFPIIGLLRTMICLGVVWLIWGRKIQRFNHNKTRSARNRWSARSAYGPGVRPRRAPVAHGWLPPASTDLRRTDHGRILADAADRSLAGYRASPHKFPILLLLRGADFGGNRSRAVGFQHGVREICDGQHRVARFRVVRAPPGP